MKFSEIKDKIQNLGNFKDLKEIKKAGLRVVRNTKTGNYWLIEKGFLKPVIKSPRECKSMLIKPEDLKYKVFMYHKSKKELRGTKAFEYIDWGEKNKFNKKPTTQARRVWYSLPKPPLSSFLWTMTYRDRFFVLINNSVYADARFYDIYIKEKDYQNAIGILLNSVLSLLSMELLARGYGGGGGPVDVKVYEVENLLIVNPELLPPKLEFNLAVVPLNTIFEQLGFNFEKPIRQQEPNPLPDRKALDDIVFDALGLTDEERKEVYWAVCELVKNRLEKAKSV